MKSRRVASASLVVLAGSLAACGGSGGDAPSTTDALGGGSLGAASADTVVDCTALVVGATLGGIAAAEELSARGFGVCLTEETNVVGGQLTAQSTPTDSLYPDMAHGFLDVHQDVLAEYRARYAGAPAGDFDPGDCGRYRCFEPSVGSAAIEHRTLARFPSVRLFKLHRPIAARVDAGGRVASITFRRSDGTTVEMRARITIDATDLGDTYPLAGVGHRVGRDARTEFAEPSAYDATPNDHGDPECVQRATWVVGLEKTGVDPNVGNPADLVARPAGYDAAKYAHGPVDMFEPSRNGMWNWRRVLAPQRDATHGLPGAADVTSMNNFAANDFAVVRSWCGPLGCSLVRDVAGDRDAVFAAAKSHTQGYVYWIQNDAVRTDGGRGYKNVRLAPSSMSTIDGYAAFPYVREGRRLRSVRVVTENDMMSRFGPRFADSVGVNRYLTDMKGCAPTLRTPAGEVDWHRTHGDLDYDANGVGHEDPVFMQIPLSALVPETRDGLLAGSSKNMGVSHIANASLRIHPGEWNAGRAAGAAAAVALANGVEPRALLANERLLRLVQQRLVASPRRGAIAWASDVPDTDRGWVAIEMMAVSGVMGGYADDHHAPDADLTRAEMALVATRELGVAPAVGCHPSFVDVPCSYFAYGAIQALADHGIVGGYADGTYRPGADVTRAQLAKVVSVSDCAANAADCYDPAHPPPAPGYGDVTTADWFYGYVATAKAHGIFRGADAGGATFSPGAPVTRREAALWLYNHLRRRLSLD